MTKEECLAILKARAHRLSGDPSQVIFEKSYQLRISIESGLISKADGVLKLRRLEVAQAKGANILYDG